MLTIDKDFSLKSPLIWSLSMVRVGEGLKVTLALEVHPSKVRINDASLQSVFVSVVGPLESIDIARPYIKVPFLVFDPEEDVFSADTSVERTITEGTLISLYIRNPILAEKFIELKHLVI